MAQWFNWRGLFSRRKEKIETLFLPVDEIALMLRVETHLIESMVSKGKVHFVLTPENEHLLCVDSVKQQI